MINSYEIEKKINLDNYGSNKINKAKVENNDWKDIIEQIPQQNNEKIDEKNDKNDCLIF